MRLFSIYSHFENVNSQFEVLKVFIHMYLYIFDKKNHLLINGKIKISLFFYRLSFLVRYSLSTFSKKFLEVIYFIKLPKIHKIHILSCDVLITEIIKFILEL